MDSLFYLLFVIALSILIIIGGVNYLKIHPFLMLIIGCLFVGFLSGMDGLEIVDLTSSGFGAILKGIGLIVVLGTFIGIYIERTGALGVIANAIVSLFGSKNVTTAMGVLGALVSVPVFCDSGFIILSKLSAKLSKMKNSSSAALSLALASGLYTTHTLIPPTPGPIAVAGNIGLSDQLGIVILTGLLVSIPVLCLSIWFALRIGKKMHVEVEDAEWEETDNAPSLLWASAPIAIPILLIAGASLTKLILGDAGVFGLVMGFVGSPLIALLIGCVLAILQLIPQVPLSEQQDLMKKGIEQAGPIILITGAGGAFGSVLKATDLSALLTQQLGDELVSLPPLLILGFLVAAILKTAQGSSTSALVITSALMAPFIASMEAGVFHLTLVVMAIGGGAMMVSHANDSYFWVVTKFSGFTMKQGYRGLTVLTLIQGLTTLLTVFALYFISLLF